LPRQNKLTAQCCIDLQQLLKNALLRLKHLIMHEHLSEQNHSSGGSVTIM